MNLTNAQTEWEAYCFSLGDIKINNEINDINTISTKENKLQYSDDE